MSKKMKLILSAVIFIAKNGYKHRELVAVASKKAVSFTKKKREGKKELKSVNPISPQTEILSPAVEENSLSAADLSKLMELQESYLEHSRLNAQSFRNSDMYAAFGAAGVSPSLLKKAEDALAIIEEFSKKQK